MEKKRHQTIDEYIKSCPSDVQTRLRELRSVIKGIVPETSEKISYQMPTFFLNGNLVHFAAHSNHIGFYPMPSGITHFKKELEKYVTSKGAIQFPLEKPLPLGLIKKIVKFRAEENSSRKSRKK
jgi:uncharacterized protein YdhG (YjbR/CyaY superfamily)